MSLDYSLSVDAVLAARWSPQVGDRVRILARPECFYCRETGELEIGMTGTIKDVRHPCKPGDEAAGRADPGCYAHCYWIDLDEELPDGPVTHCAASELEPAP